LNCKGYLNALVVETSTAEEIAAHGWVQTMRLRAVSVSQAIARCPVACLSGRAADFIGHGCRVLEQEVLAQTRRRCHLIQKRSGDVVVARVGYEQIH
jgi:hypothetical protein